MSVELRSLIRDLRHMSARAAPDLADWLVHLELEGKADRTLYTYHRELARLLRRCPDHHLEDFTPADISSLLTEVPKRSRHISRSIFNQFFEWAVWDGRLISTPMFRVPKVKHPQRAIRDIYTVAEVAQLEALPSPDGELFTILFETGIRRGEARRLRRDHVNLERKRLMVHKGKGGKDRIVAVTPAVLTAVADLDLLEGLGNEDYLWYARWGGGVRRVRRFPIGDTTFSSWYERCVARAGVPYRPPHTTRHTYHELMRRYGLTLEERKELMGHEKIATTVDQYGHVDFDEVADKLSTFSLEAL